MQETAKEIKNINNKNLPPLGDDACKAGGGVTTFAPSNPLVAILLAIGGGV